MKKRKAIAVIIGFAQCYFNNRGLQGIIKQAKKLDYDVAVFSVFTLADEKSGHQIGEENIYNLLSSKRFDGYIIVGYSFWAMVKGRNLQPYQLPYRQLRRYYRRQRPSRNQGNTGGRHRFGRVYHKPPY